jgi:hypothetical protein
MSPEEARLLALERRVYRLPVLDLERRAVALEQGLAQSWTWGVGYQTPTTPTPTPTPTQGIVVRAWGEGGVPFSGCPVTITESGGAGDSASGSTDATGYFGATLEAGTYTFNVLQLSGKTGISASGIVLPAGLTTVHVLVFATTTTHTTLSDSVYGNSTGTWDAGLGWASATTGNVAACGACAAASGVPLNYRVQNGFWYWPDGSRTGGLGTGRVQCVTRASTGCPENVSLFLRGTYDVPSAQIAPGTWTFSGGISLGWTIPTSPGNKIYCTSGATLTFTQP